MDLDYASEPRERADYECPWYLRWEEGNVYSAVVSTVMHHLLFFSLASICSLAVIGPHDELVLVALLSALPLVGFATGHYYFVYSYSNPIGYEYSFIPAHKVSAVYAVLVIASYCGIVSL